MSKSIVDKVKELVNENYIVKGILRGLILILLIFSVTIFTHIMQPEDPYVFALILSTIVALSYSVVNIWFVIYHNRKSS